MSERQESIESRIARLEDRAAIQDLKARYAHVADLVLGSPSPEHTNRLLDLFAEDGSLDLGPFGTFKGRAELARAFTEVLPSITCWSSHHITSHVVNVDGETATGTCAFLVFMKAVNPAGAPITNLYGIYDEKYRKVGGSWRFTEIVARFSAPAA